jgi:hypothetical protein
MSRQTILDTAYTFTPSTGTIVIPRRIQRERLVLITNVTTNTVIYNFSDSNLKASSFTITTPTSALHVAGQNSTTTIVLDYNTAGMSSSDKLQIIVDDPQTHISPSDVYADPVNRSRVSQPQALIDTDFEYGTQPTKWENLALTNNRPFVFNGPNPITGITNISQADNQKTVTVTVTGGAPGIGTAIIVTDTHLNIANGNFIIKSGIGSTSFTYEARAINTTGITNIFDNNKTSIFTGATYAGSQIGGDPTFGWASGQKVPVTTTIPHGLSIGNEVAIVGCSSATANGSFSVASINSNTEFTYYTNTALSENPSGAGCKIFVIPQGQFLHRPFDGGIIFTSNANGNFEQSIRQTRRYFRYQSGKGIQISSGTCLKPNLQIDNMTASGIGIGATITVQTKEQHNIQAAQPGTEITITSADQAGYNQTYTVDSVSSYNTFKVTALAGLTTTTATGNYTASVSSWFGSTNRLGLFDSQNGVFFEADGQDLYVVRRTSTFQVAGKVSVTNGSTTVTQTDAFFPTRFAGQLEIGNFIVLRGQSYRVTDIASNTSLTISPAYRGATSDFVIISKTQDFKVKQSDWNLDKCDGTGPSSYTIDLAKMQMFYIDYSWYGAGAIRYGFRGPDGDVFYCHKTPNNNVNQESFMRSGNLPGRYETESIPPTTQITETVQSSDTHIGVTTTTGFPSVGTLVIRNATTYEYCNYTGIAATGFIGVIRGQPGNASIGSTVAEGENVVSVGTTANLQVGQRIINGFPDGTYITQIGVGNMTLSQACTAANQTLIAAPMGATSGQTFTYSATDPVGVELAFPTYGPSISHWGTSVIMEGKFDDDKSLIFSFGQKSPTSITAGSSKALLAIRVAPSVDNGIAATFGQRDLINRMQLKLKSLGVAVRGSRNADATLLIEAFLNPTLSSATTWTNAVNNVSGVVNSSLAQIADFAGGTTTITGGESTFAEYSIGTSTIDLSDVRDLGNCILGGGASTANTQVYPDGPDIIVLVVTNIGGSGTVNVTGRVSWTEAQA